MQEILNKLIGLFKENGICHIIATVNQKDFTAVSFFGGEMDRSSMAQDIIITIEGAYKNFSGFLSIENVNEEMFEQYLESFTENAISNAIEFAQPLSLPPSDKGGSANLPATEDMIDLVSEAASYAKGTYSEMHNITLNLHKSKETITVIDEKGQSAVNKNEYIFASANIQVKNQKGHSQNAQKYNMGKQINLADLNTVIDKAFSEARALLDAKPVKSGIYSVVLAPEVFAQIMSSSISMFYGDSILNGMSMLAGKQEEKVFSDKLTITEDPLYEMGRIRRTFDDQLTPTYKKQMIDKGIFKCILHSQKTAQKMNQKPTGNAFRPNSPKDNPAAGITNVIITSGEKSTAALIKPIEKGILVVSVQGLHAGINTVNGDISLLSSGFLIEEGKITQPISKITVAGNLYDMLNQIEDLGSETIQTGFSPISKLPSVHAPAISIKAMTVAGL